jgi:DNA-binding HxlR family transcriptional regulator
MGTGGKKRKRRGRKTSYAAELLELIAMRHVPQALHVAAVLGIADLIAKRAKSSAELAQDTGTHAATLHRTLRTLVAAGVLSRDEKDRFRLTALGQPLRSAVGDSVRAASIFLSGESELEGQLLDCVRTGKTAIELTSGATNWIEYYQRDPAKAAVFNSAMTALSNAHYAGVVESYDFRSVRNLVDVGGGHGRLLSMILIAYPKMHGVLFELSHAVEGALQTLSAAGLTNRCEIVSGDFFRSVPAGGDTYMLSRVIHDWADDKAVAILKVVRGVLPAAGRLLLFETMIRSDKRLSYPLLSDVNMIIRTGGCERTEAEYRALYKSAGLRLTRAIQTPSPTGMTIIEGKPA